MKKTFYIIMAVYLILFAIVAKAQTVSTFAGNGSSGYTGDGGAATAAEIGSVNDLAADASGNIYFVDYSNNVVRKITPAGVISLFAGDASGSYPGDGGAATAAYLYSPAGVAVDAAGNVYISDYGHSRIRKVNTAGIISTIAGTGTTGWMGDGGAATAAKINGPSAIRLDASGNIYFADRYNNRIRRIDATTGIITTIAGDGFSGFIGDGGAATLARLDNPIGIAVDASGNIYVADYGNRRIRKISSSGTISTYAGNGTLGISLTGVPAISASINGGIGLALDASGNLYIAEDGNGHKVRVVSTSGIISDFAGTGVAGFTGDGGAAVSAQFRNTKALAFDASGNAYISDAGNYRIRKVEAPNLAPAFTAGASQTLAVCQDGGLTSINSLLTVSDTDPGQTKTWSTATLPANGILVAAYSTTSTGSTLTPTGLTYVAGAGYSGSDMFQVRVTDGSLSDTITVNVTVNPKPVPVISAAGSTLSTTAAFATYQWSSASGTLPGETNATFTAAATGTYYVTVTDANGCTGGSTGQTVTGVGIHDFSTSSIVCYPNPVTNGKLHLSIPATGNQPVHIVLINIMGTKVKEAEGMTNSPLSLDLNIPGGVYFLSAITDNGRYHVRIVVQ